jgi:hypothetical protein
MSTPERIYSGSIRTLSFIFVGLGVLILISTFANGGGPLSLGTLLGVAFLAVGVARLWLSGAFRGWRRGRGGSDG